MRRVARPKRFAVQAPIDIVQPVVRRELEDLYKFQLIVEGNRLTLTRRRLGGLSGAVGIALCFLLVGVLIILFVRETETYVIELEPKHDATEVRIKGWTVDVLIPDPPHIGRIERKIECALSQHRIAA
jgi:hypothetical protein